MSTLKDKGKDVKVFLESNSLVAKVAFIIILIILFLILFNLGTLLIAYIVEPSKSPYVVDGLITARTPYEITQDPNSKHSVTIYRSDNENDGIEFTWSVWLFIDSEARMEGSDISFNYGNQGIEHSEDYIHVFSKGIISEDGTVEANGPGLYLQRSPPKNNLIIKMDKFSEDGEENEVEDIIIEDITVGKWLNVIVRCKNIAVDVYINGTVTKQAVIETVPKQNNDNVFVSYGGGFEGNISDLRYFNHALNLSQIHGIVDDGPNLTPASISASNTGIDINPPYMSFKWFLAKNSINS